MTAVGSRAALATLVSLDGMGPARLRAVLVDRTPAEALAAVLGGDAPMAPPLGTVSPRCSRELLQRWRSEARGTDPHALLDAYAVAGYGVVMFGEAAYPARLQHDPDPPLLLSIDGDLGRLSDRTVAIVGTRRCSRAGYDTAYRLGSDLAAAGVTVVSGLAAGIDAAAHRGAIDAHGAAPLAVAGTGLDVPYPRANRTLWRDVASAGALISEAPLGARADRWRFPARNRIIAAMAEVVIVVESPARGGSMHTVDEADARSIDVLAVPGPVMARNSEGTNALLHEGRGVVRDATDVLLALGSTAPVAEPVASGLTGRSASEIAVLDAFEWEAVTADQLVLRTRLDVVEVCGILDRLVAAGEVVTRSGWYERTMRA
ncbi:MAG TPA: DNA-processing protein DprA [Acidimicrobiales bacterium]|nr:DNA-processing protein DprA [Acidimicrobiales bacterium]